MIKMLYKCIFLTLNDTFLFVEPVLRRGKGLVGLLFVVVIIMIFG